MNTIKRQGLTAWRRAAGLCALMLCMAGQPCVRAWAAGPPGVAVNNRPLAGDAAAYYSENQRLMAPVAALASGLGASARWVEATKEVLVYLGGRYAWVQAGNPTLYYGSYVLSDTGEPLMTTVDALVLDALPEIRDGRAYAPLAALTEVLGGAAVWDAAANTARVTPPPFAPEPAGTEDVPQQGADGAAEPAEPDGGGLSYFRLLDAATAREKIDNGDPFVLIAYNSARDEAALREVLRAAADMKLLVYGLDAVTDAPLFPEEEAAEAQKENAPVSGARLYLIHDSETVEVLTDFNYEAITEALRVYWAA